MSGWISLLALALFVCFLDGNRSSPLARTFASCPENNTVFEEIGLRLTRGHFGLTRGRMGLTRGQCVFMGLFQDQ